MRIQASSTALSLLFAFGAAGGAQATVLTYDIVGAISYDDGPDTGSIVGWVSYDDEAAGDVYSDSAFYPIIDHSFTVSGGYWDSFVFGQSEDYHALMKGVFGGPEHATFFLVDQYIDEESKSPGIFIDVTSTEPGVSPQGMVDLSEGFVLRGYGYGGLDESHAFTLTTGTMTLRGAAVPLPASGAMLALATGGAALRAAAKKRRAAKRAA